MFRKLDHVVSRLSRWCKGQAEREAPYMPTTAVACAVACPLFTYLQGEIVRVPKDSSWPFCLFLTGLFLHLAVGWGFEYQAKWKYNKLIAELAIFGCVGFWAVVAWSAA